MSEHDQDHEQQGGEFDVAIIGMAGRFPGADDLETFWDILRAGRETITHFSDDDLRAAGLSRQKAAYARSLAEEVTSGRLDLASLPQDDEEAIAALTRIKGIGRWSAEIYLLFAEGRPDIWPAGDLAVQIEIGRILGHAERPSEKMLRAWSLPWSPHRGAAAIFAWHHYKTDMDVI